MYLNFLRGDYQSYNTLSHDHLSNLLSNMGLVFLYDHQPATDDKACGRQGRAGLLQLNLLAVGFLKNKAVNLLLLHQIRKSCDNRS